MIARFDLSKLFQEGTCKAFGENKKGLFRFMRTADQSTMGEVQ